MSENKPNNQLRSLLKISKEPVDFAHPLLSPYPAMKLGCRREIDFYARLLAEVAEVVIKAEDDGLDWVVTAPPFNVMPAAANLLAKEVCRILGGIFAGSRRISLLEMHLPKKSVATNNPDEFKTYFEYSNNSIEERIKERQKLHQGSDYLLRHRDVFQGCGVIVINDIKVTGTQQKFMQEAFDQVAVGSLAWLYLLEVEETLGKRNPQLENAINCSRFNALDEFIKLVLRPDVTYTARCVSRMFSLDMADFTYLLHQLDDERLALIYDLARQEGRYDGEFLAPKIRLLEQACTQNA